MSDEILRDELARLRQEVDEQKARIETLESVEPPQKLAVIRSRRDLIKLAGAAVLGAAGAGALSATPAMAADGSNLVLGQLNSSTSQTTYSLTSAATPTQMLQVDASNGSGDVVGVLGVGINNGAGIKGTNKTGIAALFASGTGIDVGLGGTGRLGQANRANGSGHNYTPANGQLEMIRESDGSMWVSRASGGNALGTGQAAWKRVNAVRFDRADGTGGAYQPFRLVDTRNGTGGQGGAKANGTTTTWTVAGAGTGASSIPSDAVAVFGNLTATGYSAGGYLAIFPAGFSFNPAVGPSSLNFQVGQGAIANSFMVGLGSGGAVSVYVAAVSGTCEVIIDILGYVQ